MFQEFEIEARSSVVDAIQKGVENGEYPQISSISQKTDFDPFANKPFGTDPIVAIIVGFTVQVGATVTCDLVKKYILDRKKDEIKDNEIKVKEKE